MQQRLLFKLWIDTHPELLNEYFGNYTQVVYLAQTDDPKLEELAREAAKKLGLELVIKKTDYGDLEPEIISLSTSKEPKVSNIGQK